MTISHRRLSLSVGLLVAMALAASHSALADDDMDQLGSIAISGGASKGAYEAGLTWAAIKISRTSLEPGQLTFGGNFRDWSLASIAGTSAGGINAVLAGLSWCVRDEDQGGFPDRIDDNIFRHTWLPPDINNLLPATATAPPYLPDDAALSRVALVEVARDLQELWQQPGTFRDGCNVPIGVTVTRTQPATMIIDEIEVSNQRFFFPFEMYTRADGALGFKFDPADYPRLTDPSMILLPRAPDAAEYSVTGDQVIDAVLATSAFPTGFGRRRIAHCRLSEFAMTRDEPAPPSPDEMQCPAGYRLEVAEFADGGLFDNLPLAQARELAELRKRPGRGSPPVSYVFLDPNRYRFDLPSKGRDDVCKKANPPDACTTLPHNFAAEFEVMAGSLGTARKYALYEELTSDAWRLNLSDLSRRLAQIVSDGGSDIECPALQRFYDGDVGCVEALVRAGRLLSQAYDYRKVPVTKPASADRLMAAGIVDDCNAPPEGAPKTVLAECAIDISDYRKFLAAQLIEVAKSAGPDAAELIPSIERSARSMRNDRSVLVTSLGVPITGQLLGAFGAFLEVKFREYDYYAGIYDAIEVATRRECKQRFSTIFQQADYLDCVDDLSQRLYDNIGIRDDPVGRFVFALIAESEFGKLDRMRFAYAPMPEEDRDMRIIHGALQEVVLEDGDSVRESSDSVFVERAFFEYLRDQGFEPTPSAWDDDPLLARIIEDPDSWTYELTRRWTTRLVYLEQQAEEIYAQREPDPEKREKSRAGLLGFGAWGLQTATYRYPPFEFAPSTAPKSWLWRAFIPYEVGMDLVEGDLNAYWQPTWNFGGRTNLGLRFGFGFAGGLFKSTASAGRDNYATAGLDFTFLSKSTWVSSYGFTPAVFHNWGDIAGVDRTTYGLDVHAGFLNNRLRAGIGARDASDFSNSWFLSISIADLPGMLYWMTR